MKLLLDDLALWRRNAGRRRSRGDRGASAIEWVIITAVLVVAVSVIGGVITTVVNNQADKLEQCASTAGGGEECVGTPS
ncbi:hypothetical protein [Brevibacterium litoralis]|uniref:hypothetical protein n=1 Tax=Brevibacterium litoralis TaxID=3138935 RepID=UPI0032EBA4CB